MAFGWKTRLGLVLSAIWLCFVLLVAGDSGQMLQVFAVGALPLVVIWGTVWAFTGWRAQRAAKSGTTGHGAVQAKQAWRTRAITLAAVVAVLAIGLGVASWQTANAPTETSAGDVPRLLGEWLVYGLFAYGILRFVPRLPSRAAAVLAATIIVGGVNFETNRAIALDRAAVESLARATPLILKIQGGDPVSDLEVRSANVGLLEPLILAQAAFGRDVLSITSIHRDTMEQLQLDVMLTPQSLASRDIRAQSRNKLVLWQQANSELEGKIAAAIARAKLNIEAAQSQLPQEVRHAVTAGFDRASGRITDHVRLVVSSSKDASNAAKAVLDLMEANEGRFAVDRGPPPNLLFRDMATLEQFRRHIDAVLRAAQREQQSQASFMGAQTELMNSLAETLKKR